MNIRGRIDRVDSVVFTDEVVEQLNKSGLFAESAEELPLILMPKNLPQNVSSLFEISKPSKALNQAKKVHAMLLGCSRKFNLLFMHVLGRLHTRETE